MAPGKSRLFIIRTLKHGKTVRLSLFLARPHARPVDRSRARDVNFWQVSRRMPPTSCLYVALKALSISEEARFEIANCAGFYAAKRPARSILARNGEVFTGDSDINLHRFFSITRYHSCHCTTLALVRLAALRFSNSSLSILNNWTACCRMYTSANDSIIPLFSFYQILLTFVYHIIVPTSYRVIPEWVQYYLFRIFIKTDALKRMKHVLSILMNVLYFAV